MNNKHFTDPTLVQQFVDDLQSEEKWVIDIRTMPENMGYVVEWQEHKKYTALDGKEYLDEVWTTEAGQVVLVQDMSEAHVRNTLRMLLRNDRETQAAVDVLTRQISEVIDSLGTDTEDDTNDFALPEDTFGISGPTTLQ